MEKKLGHATAYGYAKSKGYSGTEEEFAELMADYASVGQSAAQSAEQAAASATSASASAQTASQAAQTATSKASEAVTAADTATAKASGASTSADTASAAATSAITSAQTATTAATTATTKASEASESATTASTAKTDAETARDAAAQSASEAAESARTLIIDATLTQSGQAADAEATGDAITGLENKLNKVISDFSGNPVDFYSEGSALESCVLELPLKQEGSGTPSGTNIRNIMPTTSATVTLNGDDTIITFGTGGIAKGIQNLSTGEQMSEYGFHEFDGSESWALHGTNPSWFYVYYTLPGAYTENSKNDFAVSNKYVQGKANDNNILADGRFTIGMVGTNMRIVVKDTRFTTLDTFVADMASNHLQIAYKYETPVKTEQTPVILQTEKGSNTISSDVGTLTFSAKQSVEDYVTRVIEPIYDVELFSQSDFEQGTIDASGYPGNNNYRIRFKNFYVATMDFYVSNAIGYDINLFKYQTNGTLISTTGFAGDGKIHTYAVSKGDRIKIAIGKYPISVTSVSDYVGLKVVGINKIDAIDSEIEWLTKAAESTDKARIAEVFDRAGLSETENLSFFANAYYVGADKTYTTINAALAQWATDGYPDAVVYISNGEYNETVFVENHNIAFIGESKEGTIIRTKTGAYSYPPFKIHHGNVLVANLTAIADHSDNPNFEYNTGATMAYAFHIDGGNVGGLVHIKNCKAVSFQSPSFGMGTIPNSIIRLEDVEAFSFTAIGAGESLNSGNILCHLASPSVYPTQGTETLELINVKAYAKNTARVIFLSQGNSTNSLKLKAINVTTASGSSDVQDNLVVLPTNYTIDDLSTGNTCGKLNQ